MWGPESYAALLRSVRKPEVLDWPERDPDPEVRSTDPRPADAPAEPRAVKELEALAVMAGFEVRIGYARGRARAVKRGTYKALETFAVYGLLRASGWRFSARYDFSPDLKGGWKWGDTGIWLPGHTVAPGLGVRFTLATITDLKEWVGAAGNVTPAWFKGIHARVTEQAEKQRQAAKERPASKKAKEGMS